MSSPSNAIMKLLPSKAFTELFENLLSSHKEDGNTLKWMAPFLLTDAEFEVLKDLITNKYCYQINKDLKHGFKIVKTSVSTSAYYTPILELTSLIEKGIIDELRDSNNDYSTMGLVYHRAKLTKTGESALFINANKQIRNKVRQLTIDKDVLYCNIVKVFNELQRTVADLDISKDVFLTLESIGHDWTRLTALVPNISSKSSLEEYVEICKALVNCINTLAKYDDISLNLPATDPIVDAIKLY